MSAPETADGGSGEEELRTRIRRLEAAVVVLLLGLVGTVTWAALASPNDDVLRAERLEIVEPDGQPAFVLANSERPARGTFDGEVLMEDRTEERAMPSFIFFDGHGDEVGGMLFGNRESGDGFTATRHLSLDAYKHDQTVQIFHRQNPRGAFVGPERQRQAPGPHAARGLRRARAGARLHVGAGRFGDRRPSRGRTRRAHPRALRREPGLPRIVRS